MRAMTDRVLPDGTVERAFRDGVVADKGDWLMREGVGAVGLRTSRGEGLAGGERIWWDTGEW